MKTLNDYKAALEAYLEALPISGAPDILRQAMRYSLLAGGKRLRGCLLLAAADMAGEGGESALPFAAALEMIHAYSLIHDDLPAMDNDTLRRGKPTSHVVYGEAVAILAGDALLTHAFETMLKSDHPRALPAILEIAAAAGVGGMLAGQTLDVTNEGETPNKELVLRIHEGKTAALLTAPVTAGLILGGADNGLVRAGRAYGYHLGLAFQIVDDLLDLKGDPALMGKTLGKDLEEKKLTWPACVGESQARRDAETHIRAAADAFAPYGDRALFFRDLAFSTLNRTH
ncbi:MAG: polyprenyl synthetase family protein [Clostridia bacterium]|nr:polyprenyl synthetase family protein [Clostridia bacterium]